MILIQKSKLDSKNTKKNFDSFLLLFSILRVSPYLSNKFFKNAPCDTTAIFFKRRF